MKIILFIGCLLFLSHITFAQSVEQEQSGIKDKVPIILSALSTDLMNKKELSLNDKFILYKDSPPESLLHERKINNELNNAKTEAAAFSIAPEVYYFAGAAAVAAIIYFLIPDSNPPAPKNYTFGLPVTPK